MLLSLKFNSPGLESMVIVYQYLWRSKACCNKRRLIEVTQSFPHSAWWRRLRQRPRVDHRRYPCGQLGSHALIQLGSR